MIVVMKPKVSVKAIGAVLKRLEALGLAPHISRKGEQTMIGIVGEVREAESARIQRLEGVAQLLPVRTAYKLASREFHPQPTSIPLPGVVIGARDVVVMAGPCAVESYEQTWAIAKIVKHAGVRILRGGAYKPRTSPYSFQGLGPKGLEILSAVKRELGMLVVTEVLSPADVGLVAEHADILQVGMRNMSNFTLLAELGKARRPVLLKRGVMSSLEEFLMSAEYVLTNGNPHVILCERGIRTFEKLTRNPLDLSAVPLLKRLSHLPVAVDPSHATGTRELVPPMALAAVAAGADAVEIDRHHPPEEALCDGPQALLPKEFSRLMRDLRPIAAARGRALG